MYTKMFKGKKIRIANHHYKLLLRRFDINNFMRETARSCSVTYTLIKNNVPCALCDTFFKGNPSSYDCSSCPFTVFTIGCAYVLNQLLPSARLRHLLIHQSYISYTPMYSSSAIKELAVIYEFLKSFKKE
jgi:hypothetical protein